jgi:integrase
MPRKAAWPPKVQFHRASGRDRIRVNGDDYYLGPHDSEESRVELARLMVELAAGRAPAPALPGEDPSVAQVVEAWRASPQGEVRLSARDRCHYRLALAALVGPHAETPAAAFRARQLREVRDLMVAGRGWCPRHANRQVGRLRALWRWAEEQELVPAGSWHQLRTLPELRTQPAKRREVMREEVDRIAAQCRAPVRAMLWLLWHTGMRPAEVVIMRPCDIDTGGGATRNVAPANEAPGGAEKTLKNVGDVWVYRPASHKKAWRGESREVALGPACQQILAPWLAHARPQGHLFRPRQCAARGRQCYRPEHLSRYLRLAAGRAGIAGFYPYLLRHAFRLRATRELGLDFARAAMGHTSMAMTAEYAKGADMAQAAEVARRLG